MLCKSFRTRPTGNCRLGSREFNPGPRAPENLGKLKLLNYEIASDTAAVYMPAAIKSEMAIFECNGMRGRILQLVYS